MTPPQPEPELQPVVCTDCRFYRWEFCGSVCAVNQFKLITTSNCNPDGMCRKFRARIGQRPSLMIWAGAGIGSAVTTLLWWLLS